MRWLVVAVLSFQSQEDTVAQAVADFQKAFAGSEQNKIDALDHLRDLAHDKVFPEFAKALADAPAVRAKAIDVLSAIDHPKAAEMLSAAVKSNIGEKATRDALLNALNRVQWDAYYAAVADSLADKMLDPALTGQAFLMVSIAERIGSPAFADALIRGLKIVEEKLNEGGARLTGNADEYLGGLRRSIKACTGEEKATGAEYETWWKKNKAPLLKKGREVLWCKSSGRRWDRAAGDAKAICPHHEDKQQASRDAAIVALRTLR
jgi:hypothetical protein